MTAWNPIHMQVLVSPVALIVLQIKEKIKRHIFM
jgi:hypothetical protein